MKIKKVHTLIIVLMLTAAAVSLGACAQEPEKLPDLDKIIIGNVFEVEIQNISPPSVEAQNIFNRLQDIAGLKRTIKLYAADVKGTSAFASYYEGHRIIVYDRTALRFELARTTYSAVWILAHELGHHVGSHNVSDARDSKAKEREADRWAGYALARLSLPKAAIASPFEEFIEETETHPSSVERIAQGAEGWELGNLLKAIEAPSCKAGWASELLDVDGSVCRLATLCAGKQSIPKLACEDYEGNWVVK